MPRTEYEKKRDFKKTPEPASTRRKPKKSSRRASFVVQKHAASHLHYDFRLELGGVLKSWAVPRGPSLDSHQKRLAVQVEDHPLEYAKFEGRIPEGEYGAGEVIVWDSGKWIPKGDANLALQKGVLEFSLEGKKLHGKWVLVRTRPSGGKSQWLLIKRSDSSAVPESKYRVTVDAPESVLSGKVLGGERRLKKTKFEFVYPQLAKLAKEPPLGRGWLHEVKFDGYRTLAQMSRGKTRLFTRMGKDWTKKYGTIAEEVGQLPVASAWIDGEIAFTDEKGVTQFNLLQKALSSGSTSRLIYYVFDLLELNGEDLRPLPLKERKKRLAGLLKGARASRILYSDHWKGSGPALLGSACKLGLEGIISKDEMQSYTSGRGLGWIKTKCTNEQEFVIGGYVQSDARAGFRSLLLGLRHGKTLKYIGKVGTGFDAKEMRELLERFKPLVRVKSPFAPAEVDDENVVWLRPKLVAEVAFRSWTDDHLLRQASYKGLRLDKPAREVVHEEPIQLNARSL